MIRKYLLKMQIKFINPNKRLDGERKSKLLDPSSEFYKYLDTLDKKLNEAYPGKVGSKRMDYHIELIFRNDPITDDLLVKRAQELEGKKIGNLEVIKMGRALVIETPNIDGFKTHATVSFFPGGFPETVSKILSELVHDTV